jgi:hypothetical protein
METLVAMGAISLAMIILGLSLSSAAGAMARARDHALFGIRLLRADSLIRDRLAAVAIPYWERPVPETEGSSVRIPWYQGEREGHVTLLVEGGALVMETGDKRKTERIPLLSGLDSIELALLRTDENAPYGVGVSYHRGQKIYHTMAAFASFPVARLSAEVLP